MSLEDAKKFMEKMEKDVAFRVRIIKEAKDNQERREILRKMHLNFTKEEYKKAFQENFHRSLSDVELQKISAAGALRPELGEARADASTLHFSVF